MGTFFAELEEIYGDLVMWKYVIQDLLGTVKYAPYGILIGCLLYSLLLIVRKKRGVSDRKKKTVAEMLFWIYVAVMVVITFLSREGGSASGMDLRIGSSLGINSRNDAYAVENILLFIPYGFLLGWVWKKEKGFLNTLSAGFLTSFGIESLQLISGRGVFQADDLITNTLGAVVGYMLYMCVVGKRKVRIGEKV